MAFEPLEMRSTSTAFRPIGAVPSIDQNQRFPTSNAGLSIIGSTFAAPTYPWNPLPALPQCYGSGYRRPGRSPCRSGVLI
ncbi:MAG: hypothetical protein ACI8TP_003061 [Acidimicrobiales bacterium]|jgi:hypothetical protein